jgi:hypothetical protein
MAWLMWLVGAVLVLGAAVFAFTRGGRHGDTDLGTISSSWIAEHRSQERQSDNNR